MGMESQTLMAGIQILFHTGSTYLWRVTPHATRTYACGAMDKSLAMGRHTSSGVAKSHAAFS
jgi:hypothetical protein